MSAAKDLLVALHAAFSADAMLMDALPGGIGDGGAGTRPLPALSRTAVSTRLSEAGETHAVTFEATGEAGSEAALLAIAARLIALLPSVRMAPGAAKLSLIDHRGTTTRRSRQGRLITVEIRLLAITE